MQIALSPHGHLYRLPDEGEEALFPVRKGGGEGDDSADLLLHLATKALQLSLPLCAAYWREFGRRYLTVFCRTPERLEIPPPSEAEWEAFLESAPPMRGGEYLRVEGFNALWRALDERVQQKAKAHPGGVQEWLKAQNPAWNLVGRVSFHLAENKKNPERPFAFLATYTHLLTSQGKPQYVPLGNALREYAGAKEALLSLLLPVHRAAEKSEAVKELVDSRRIFQPLAWSAREAYRFLKEVPVLEESGVLVRLPDWWKAGRAARPAVRVSVGEERPSAVGLGALLDFKVGLTLEGEELGDAEWKKILSSTDGLVFLRGQWVEVDPSKLKEVLEHWRTLETAHRKNGVSFAEAFRLLSGMAPGGAEPEAEQEAVRKWSFVQGGEWINQQLAQLRDPRRSGRLPAGFKAELRPYQQEGVYWLRFMAQLGLGACLADDMGLGKTVQVLAALSQWKQEAKQEAPALLIAPTSVLGNWEAEAVKFAPKLRLFMAHPSCTPSAILNDPVAVAEAIAKADLVATTYGMIARQQSLREREWSRVILDEAQAIKTPGARQSKAVKELRSPVRIALTGTPIENSLGDLWSLFDFLNPGLLGSAKAFTALAKRINRSEDPARFAPLRRLVRPFILRRLKTDRKVIADLPDKTEVRAFCALSKRQAALYQQTVDELARHLEAVEGIKRRGVILSTLMRLKQLCNHPAQFLGGEYMPEESGKFRRLAQIAEEIAARQEKVLIFTQFREMTRPLHDYLAGQFGRSGLILHGGTPAGERRKLVEAFQCEEGPPFFVLSLKAGGTGLTLTQAAHVIHFDRWWNPAVENQATDRAFRIGQKKNVMVHKFVCRGTVEEKIDRLIADKRGLSEGVLTEGGESALTEMNNDELLRLVSLDLQSALAGQ